MQSLIDWLDENLIKIVQNPPKDGMKFSANATVQEGTLKAYWCGNIVRIDFKPTEKSNDF